MRVLFLVKVARNPSDWPPSCTGTPRLRLTPSAKVLFFRGSESGAILQSAAANRGMENRQLRTMNNMTFSGEDCLSGSMLHGAVRSRRKGTGVFQDDDRFDSARKLAMLYQISRPRLSAKDYKGRAHSLASEAMTSIPSGSSYPDAQRDACEAGNAAALFQLNMEHQGLSGRHGCDAHLLTGQRSFGRSVLKSISNTHQSPPQSAKIQPSSLDCRELVENC